MNEMRAIELERATAIGSVYLLNSGLVKLLPDYNEFDFLAISKTSPNKKIAIEIQATRYSKREIEKIFEKKRIRLAAAGLPVLLMYINERKEIGYFEVIDRHKHHQQIEPLQTDKLQQQLQQLV